MHQERTECYMDQAAKHPPHIGDALHQDQQVLPLASSLVVLAHKAEDPKDPAMFRMIALTPTMGKIYHQVKAERMAKYMRQWCKSQRFNTIIEYFLLEHPFVNKTWVNR